MYLINKNYYNWNIKTNLFIIINYSFIDDEGNATVNISSQTARQIKSEMPLPTVGIFDNAKEEVVEMMYTSIYPILLKNNEKSVKETLK